MFQMLLCIIYPTDLSLNVIKIREKINTHYAKYQHCTVCSFTDLSKLKALQLSKVSLCLSTIKHQHS